MKLYASAASPYARIIRAMMIEKNLGEQVEINWLNPWDSPEELVEANPFSRVPTLVTDQGQQLTESLIIAHYLERLFPDPALIPAGAPEPALAKLGLAAGAIDSAVGLVIARRFEVDLKTDPMARRRIAALDNSFPVMAGMVSDSPTPDLGDLALAVSLGYLDFRLAGVDGLEWSTLTPELKQWYETIAQRPSLAETAPHD
ncbi:MAG: glutathione S-transferase family protein [Xanthomonadaceae bacterium]|nr:glutathione S-transferase family protein [Xanthomonadaceae bacterium]